MFCWKCGTQVAGNVCTVCGCKQNERRNASTETGEALRYAYDKFGSERILTEQNLMKRCLSDLLPDEKRLRLQISSAMNTAFGQDLYVILRDGRNPSSAELQKLTKNLHVDCNITESDAQAIVGLFIDMIGCGNPLNQQFQAQRAPNRETHVEQTHRRRANDFSRVSTADDSNLTNVASAPVVFLARLSKVAYADATNGLGGGKGKRRGELFIRSDGIALHLYRGYGTNSYSYDPDLFIPQTEICRVTENFFLNQHDFTIATLDGRRYRFMPSANKEEVVRVIRQIQNLISDFE